VLLLLQDAVIILDLDSPVIGFGTVQFFLAHSDFLFDHLDDVLQIVKQDFLVLLRGRLLVSVVDLLQIVELLVKHNLDVLDGIVQVEVLAVFI